MIAAALLGLGLALADEPTTALRVRRQTFRTYPWVYYRDHSLQRRCVVDATLDDKGRPVAVVPVDCPPELERWTVSRVRRDRWVAPTPEGTVVRVEVVYEPPADAMDFPTFDTWRRREDGQCELHLRVQPDGSTAVRRTSDCDVVTAPFPRPPERLVARRVPHLCPVTFTVSPDGSLRDLDLFRCAPGAWATVREGLDAWRFPASERPKPWSVILELVGPDPGPRTKRFPKRPLPR